MQTVHALTVDCCADNLSRLRKRRRKRIRLKEIRARQQQLMAEAPMKKSLEGQFVSVLELSLRHGETVVMAEVRTASSPAERPQ